ncbi:lysoplasmalogenase [Desulfosporosinus nitroreducens]|uniref:Lysoplasmalogenase n=1 Tax=Desulfosporosinus nitroreducens TaxID=2018668 RepID=A0ABT8QLD1_9FIRM|nr:lysoplasmalogenase [Desulfosporosinus nitroreducens]MDO0821935.1 lysoplasmalogenase [Desulfosporosinus nitroreducens]
MILQILIVIVFIAAFIGNLYADRHSNLKLLKGLTKSLLVPLIILFYLISAEHINYFIVTALFLGFLGDVSLLCTKKLFFAIGLLAFLVGHLFYTLAFLQSTQYFEIVPIWFFAILIPYILYGLAILRILRPNLKEMLVPVVVYMCVILIMSFTSSSRIWNGFTPQFLLPFIGSLFFIASDSVLAYNNFNAPSANYEQFIMFTYILAQVLIVAGFLY